MILLPISLGVFLIWWSLHSINADGREHLYNSIRNADYFWVFISLFLGLLSHLSRAYRWKFLLEPLGYKPKFLNSVFTIFTAYLINLIIPRAGEVARATAISKYEAIPVEKAFGTIVAERIVDVIMLLIIIIVAFFYQFDLIKDLISKRVPQNPIAIIALLILAVFLLIFFYFLIRKSKSALFVKIRKFIGGLIEGVLSVLRMKKSFAFIVHSIFIWAMYLLMFYTVSFALPETVNLSMGAVVTGFVVGALSMATTNGGVGTYQIGVQHVLIMYGISENPALAFGMLMWSAQTLMVLIFGGLSFIALPLYNRKFLE